ncbi:MAG: hypothetical protein NT150_08190 [Bacteroidetes bacterium]|nr:hypothetical protein [Bacteroidota bacterium]
MAELKKNKKGDLQASTIVEVLVAVTIISICFTAFFICFQLVSSNAKSVKMMRAMEVIEDMKQRAELDGDLADDEQELGSLKIVKTVKEGDTENLKQLNFQVMQDTMLIETVNYFIVPEK